MILQALNHYYDQLVADGTLERPGWQPVKVSYALQIDDDGRLVRVLPLMTEAERGKKKVLVPRVMNLPARQKKTSGIACNFLCDNSSYILGIDKKSKPERTMKCFQACRELHIELLKDVESAPARAICHFFESWDPLGAGEYPQLSDYLEDLQTGANITFAYASGYVCSSCSASHEA